MKSEKLSIPKSRWPWMLGQVRKQRELVNFKSLKEFTRGYKLCPYHDCTVCDVIHSEGEGLCPCSVYVIGDLKDFAWYLLKKLQRDKENYDE